jgi:hypothetical protein
MATFASVTVDLDDHLAIVLSTYTAARSITGKPYASLQIDQLALFVTSLLQARQLRIIFQQLEDELLAVWPVEPDAGGQS